MNDNVWVVLEDEEVILGIFSSESNAQDYVETFQREGPYKSDDSFVWEEITSGRKWHIPCLNYLIEINKYSLDTDAVGKIHWPQRQPQNIKG